MNKLAETSPIQGDPKVIRGWLFYDWANSVYSLTIVTAVFPLYYLAITSNPEGNTALVNFLGLQVNSLTLYSFALSFTFLLSAVLTPLLSGIADYAGKRMFFMKIFCYLGAVSCGALFFFDDASSVEFGIIPFILAGVGFSGSIVFYNSYLPVIAAVKDQDRISAKGYSYGYIGSVILLVVNLALIMGEEHLGLPAGMGSRISFVMVALWWFGFAQITFNRLPANVFNKKPAGNLVFHGFRELKQVFLQLNRYGNLRWYLLSFFFFSMGVQTVMYMAPTFAEQEIRMDSGLLIAVILIIQLVAIAGAFCFTWLSSKFGNIKALGIAIVCWLIVLTGVYFVYNATPFIVVAVGVGLIMGGSQSLSRSTWSKLLPETEDHASFFSFYDVSEKLSIVAGTFMYGLIYDFTGSLRNTIIALASFFIIAFVVLMIVNSRTNTEQAGRIKNPDRLN